MQLICQKYAGLYFIAATKRLALLRNITFSVNHNTATIYAHCCLENVSIYGNKTMNVLFWG